MATDSRSATRTKKELVDRVADLTGNKNPKTLERVQVPPKRSVKFKTGRLMKMKLQQKPVKNTVL